jgi:hypothetical protein
MKTTSSVWPRFLATGVLLAALPAGSGAPAGFRAMAAPRLASQDEAMNFTLEGKINKLEPNKFIVAGEENMLFHVRYDDKTEIKNHDGSAATAKKLRIGMSVKVEGDLTESGEVVAKKIEIENGAEKKPPASR